MSFAKTSSSGVLFLLPLVILDMETLKNETMKEGISRLNLVTYEFIMPLIALIGFLGNMINLVVLSSKELKTTSRGNKVSQRSKSMFSYMKALAITDLLYLTMTFQGCYFTIKVLYYMSRYSDYTGHL